MVDALIEEIIAADSREQLDVRVRALDRVLRAKQIWVPNWHKGAFWVAYWDVFGMPRGAARLLPRRRLLVVRPGEVRQAEGRGRAALTLMGAYVLRRLLLIVPTLFGILLINFLLVQFMPGGPIEQIIAQLDDQTSRHRPHLRRRRRDRAAAARPSTAAPQGLPPEFIADLEKQFGFDKPPATRFLLMLRNYLTFNFGESYFRSISVVDLVLEKMPVSITLGLWSTLLAYLISIPLGIRKAIRDGSRFDTATSGAIIVAYAIPSFLFAIMLLVSSPAAPTGGSSRCAA